jgi:hypothetical protein
MQTSANKQAGKTEATISEPDLQRLVLLALGEFQHRGFVLAGRELALDRLRGALLRAAQTLQLTPIADENAADALRTLGARVVEVPTFVAKHPYRVVVPDELANQARQLYAEFQRSQNKHS